MVILDCTLRDGGYYTNWDFSTEIVDSYLEYIQKLPVDYIEIGYRNPPDPNGYFGEYFHLSVEKLAAIKKKCHHSKLAIMLDGKKLTLENINPLIEDIRGIVDLIRLTVPPSRIEYMIPISNQIKKFGFEVAFNLMYMSKVELTDELVQSIGSIENIDYLYVVDSYGGILPHEMKDKIETFKSVSESKIGFHGHNNLELALANSIEAINANIDIIDSTVLGMGRGAGNLKTELLMTYLVSKKGYDIDMNILGNILNLFDPLFQKYKWGTNFPYMLAGSSNLAQGQVMEWLGTNRYSVNTVVRGILTSGKSDTPTAIFDPKKYASINKIFVIGGGPSIRQNYTDIIKLISNESNSLIIHSSSKYIKEFEQFDHDSILSLSGSEVDKLAKYDAVTLQKIKEFILPPSPRKLGTSIIEQIRDKTVELKDSIFPNEFEDSPLSISLSIANSFDIDTIYLLGFDGYEGNSLAHINLREENQNIIEIYLNEGRNNLVSLTKTNYRNLNLQSLFAKTMYL